jgi:Hint module
VINGIDVSTAQSSQFKAQFADIIASVLELPAGSVSIASVAAGSAANSAILFYIISLTSVTMEAVKTALDTKVTNGELTSKLAVAYPGTSTTAVPTYEDRSSSIVVKENIHPASCFAGSETVQLESGTSKAMSDVAVGDRVLAADITGKTAFSDVVYVPHARNSQRAVFARISTESGRDVQMTLNHLLPAGRCGSALPLTYASKVTVGDCIMTVSGEEKVSAAERVQGSGVYTIVTKLEYVVVNGVIASPFGANHMMANLYYNIHRFVYAIAPVLLRSGLAQYVNEGLGIMIPFFGPSAMGA